MAGSGVTWKLIAGNTLLQYIVRAQRLREPGCNGDFWRLLATFLKNIRGPPSECRLVGGALELSQRGMGPFGSFWVRFSNLSGKPRDKGSDGDPARMVSCEGLHNGLHEVG